jgi:hypothetical protein
MCFRGIFSGVIAKAQLPFLGKRMLRLKAG